MSVKINFNDLALQYKTPFYLFNKNNVKKKSH